MATEMDKGPVEVPTVTIVHKETISNPNPTLPFIEFAGPYPNFGMWGLRDNLTQFHRNFSLQNREENVRFLNHKKLRASRN
jgi:hypothetical protein